MKTESSPVKKRVADYREREKNSGKKTLSVLISEMTHKRITSYATEHDINQGAAVDALLSQHSNITCNDSELEKLNQANERLVIERDKHYQRVIDLENQNRDLKRQPDKLRAEITRLKHLEHDCQAIKANGERCDRPAKGKVNFHGVEIHVCLQHQNQLMKNSSEPEPIPLKSSRTKGEMSKIRTMAREKYDILKLDKNGNVAVKTKLSSLSGAFSEKLYLELIELGVLERI
jgi:hypothetical protein